MGREKFNVGDRVQCGRGDEFDVGVVTGRLGPGEVKVQWEVAGCEYSELERDMDPESGIITQLRSDRRELLVTLRKAYGFAMAHAQDGAPFDLLDEVVVLLTTMEEK